MLDYYLQRLLLIMTSTENKIKVFFDTNVIIDAFTLRDNNYRDSFHLMNLSASGKIKGYICSKQITDIYYILRKYIDNNDLRMLILKDITEAFTVLPLLPSDIDLSLKSELKDYEDAVLNEVAKVNCVNFFVTHNIKHYEKGSVFTMTPTDLYNFIINNNLLD